MWLVNAILGLMILNAFGEPPELRFLLSDGVDEHHLIVAVLFKHELENRPENRYLCRLIKVSGQEEKVCGEFGGLPSAYAAEVFSEEFQVGIWITIPVGERESEDGSRENFLIDKSGKYQIRVFDAKKEEVIRSSFFNYIVSSGSEGFIVFSGMTVTTKAEEGKATMPVRKGKGVSSIR